MLDTIIIGDAPEALRGLPDGCVDLCCTSPPYWGLRDYGMPRQLGLEPTLDEYVANMVAVFREVRRVLKPSGSLYLNLGDSYARDGAKGDNSGYGKHADWCADALHIHERPVPIGLKPKDLCGVPWRVAFALQADGWWLREDIIWAKGNPMPESVRDRCTRSHEYLFHLTKSARYYYDSDAIAEPVAESTILRCSQPTFDEQTGGEKDYRNGTNASRSQRNALERVAGKVRGRTGATAFRGQGHFRDGENGPANREGREMRDVGAGLTRNKRSVWQVNTKPFPGAHFAVMPEALVVPCVRAACPPKVCGECGQLWERVVERGNSEHHCRPGCGCKERESGLRQDWSDGYDGYGGFTNTAVATDRFEPTCDCDAPTRPGLVLDPFMGSGTVGVVSVKEGRHYLGIELNPEYAQMARDRIAAAQPALMALEA